MSEIYPRPNQEFKQHETVSNAEGIIKLFKINFQKIRRKD
jgi:hypothetical protein